jgi:hypothetical protein
MTDRVVELPIAHVKHIIRLLDKAMTGGDLDAELTSAIEYLGKKLKEALP